MAGGGYNALMGPPPAAVRGAEAIAQPGGAIDSHPMTGGAAGLTKQNPPLVLALVVLGSVAVLAGLNLAGFKGTIAVGRT